MSTIELRHHSIEKLSSIDDDSFLKSIKTIIESKVNEGVYSLSDFQKKPANSGRENKHKAGLGNKLHILRDNPLQFLP